ncbi:MAG: hypothetical protein QOF77_742 [Solirubrobacteraceae bacterium]|nr:hypothetical protein [Solirubrobacteraceae bacterium]
MKRRLVLAIAGVAACAVALFALPLGVALERGYRSEELLRLQRDTVAATRAVDLTAGAHDRVELPTSSDQLAIYGVAGSLIAGRGPASAGAAARAALRSRRPTGVVGSATLVVAVPVLSGERVTGVVVAQRSQRGITGRTRRAWLALGGLAAGVVGLAVLAAVALGRRLARPLETLAATARRVGEGDFAARAPATSIREIDEVADALNRSSRHIHELISRERSFSANASHQLRTPLAAMRLELEGLALAQDEPLPEVTSALAQVERLQSTIETLLSVARGTPQAERTSDLGVLVRDLADRWHGRLAAAGRPLHVQVDAEPSAIGMSPAVLGEIAEVLMENALVHGDGAVTVTVRRVGRAMALEVADRGPGFGPDPDAAFARGRGSGHGIGLALARSLADADGGRLQISHAGSAPTVTLLVPCAESEPGGGEASEDPQPGRRQRPGR